VNRGERGGGVGDLPSNTNTKISLDNAFEKLRELALDERRHRPVAAFPSLAQAHDDAGAIQRRRATPVA
jgi:hypothetical protein